MIITHSLSSTGKRYSYFTCIGKHQKRTGCTMRAIAISTIEELIEDHYATIELPRELREEVERELREELHAHYDDARTNHQRLTTRRKQLLDERSKLLEAHSADAVPLELLKSEQHRIAQELDSIDSQLTATNDHEAQVETNLSQALDLASDCHQAYLTAPPPIRRRFNQIFFDKLYIDDDSHVRSQLAAPFDTLLDNDICAHALAASRTTPDIAGVSRNGGTANDSSPRPTKHLGPWRP
jgi:hypothetical protein